MTYITVKTAELEFGETAHNIRRYFTKGAIQGTREGKKIMVDRKSLEEYIAAGKPSVTRKSENQPTGEALDVPSLVDNLDTTTKTVDLLAPMLLPKKEESSNSRPKGARKEMNPGSNKADQKSHRKDSRRGPLRYAKDSMRRFRADQMIEVINWLLNRLHPQTGNNPSATKA